MKKKLYFVVNFYFNMEDNVYVYNFWFLFGDSGKVLYFLFFGFFFMYCKKKILGNVRFIEDVFVIEKEIILNI